MLQAQEIPLSIEHSAGSRLTNGSGEIRTHGTLSRTHTFQACALNHSATDPTPAWCPHPTSAKRAGGADRRPSALTGSCSCTITEQGTDRVRFELTIPLRVRRFSRPVLSTTQPPVRNSRVIYPFRRGVSTKSAARRAVKNARNNAPHSSSRTPPRTCGWWLSFG